RDDLLCVVAGFVAQIMREELGSWSDQRIQQRIRSNEFSEANDFKRWHEHLNSIAPQAQQGEVLDNAVLEVFQLLAANWKIVDAVAQKAYSKYDSVTRKGWLYRSELPKDLEENLTALRP